MGAWGATMYVSPEGVKRMARMVMSLPVLAYMASLPRMLWRRRRV